MNSMSRRIGLLALYWGRIWVLALLGLGGWWFSAAQAQYPPPGPAQQGGVNFSVERTGPASPAPQMPQAPGQPPLAPPPGAPMPLAPPQAPPMPLAPPQVSPMPLAPAPVSAAPPVPPKLGRPEDPTEKPEDTGKPLTPAEIEANKKKDQITDELRASNQAALSDYSFQAGSMHDPFMPIETVARPPASDPKSTEVKPVLQQMALSQFTLTAIVLKDDPSQSMAMVDSGGKGYIIYLGTLIGNNNGVVKEITTNKVIIEEPEPSYRTGGAARRTELRLTTAQDNEGIEFSIDGQ